MLQLLALLQHLLLLLQELCLQLRWQNVAPEQRRCSGCRRTSQRD